eukprot:5073016-Amphidinium_carterae.1
MHKLQKPITKAIQGFQAYYSGTLCVYIARACVRACVRACECVCVRACVRVSTRARVGRSRKQFLGAFSSGLRAIQCATTLQIRTRPSSTNPTLVHGELTGLWGSL